MPRRPATIEEDIPLFLIPHIVMLGVRTHGEGLERIIVSRTHRHFYSVSIRTRPLKRELKGKQPPHDAAEAQKYREGGEQE